MVTAEKELLCIDIETIVLGYGLSAFFRYKRILYPGIEKEDYLSIRDKLLDGLTTELLIKAIAKKNTPK